MANSFPRLMSFMTREQVTFRKALMACSDIAAIIAAALLSFLAISVISSTLGIPYVAMTRLFDERLLALISTAGVAAVYFLYAGHYHMRIPFWEETKSVTTACLMGLFVEVFLIFANKADVSRASTILSWIVAPFLVMWTRRLFRRVLWGRGGVAVRAIVFGRDAETARAIEIINSDAHYGVTAVGIHNVTDVEEAISLLFSTNADEAIIALSCADDAEIALAGDLHRRGFAVCVIPPAMGMSASMNVHYILGRDAILLSSRPEVTPRLNRAAKRLFDIVVAGTMLAVLSVPMAAVAAIVSLDGGSPFYRHTRVGRNGRTFGCLKFRSMRVDADQKLDKYLDANPVARASWEMSRKLPDDPRITKIGKFIRKASIDELPQLVNVIVGDMSLVGPRPITETELDKYGSARSLYTSVMPGVTGLWQVSGRSDLTYERRVALDTWYVENWSPWHDIAILSKTVPVVLGRGGAY